MKKQKLITIVLALALSSLSQCLAQDDLHTGFGVSDYDTVLTVNIAETVWTDIARLYNTGDFNMTVTCTWIGEHNPVGVQLDLTPETVRLQPDETVLVRARAIGQREGDFTGEIDFSCDVELPIGYTGNPSVPGGTAHARFIVLSELSSPLGFNWMLFGIGLVAIGVLSVATVVYWKKRKSDKTK